MSHQTDTRPTDHGTAPRRRSPASRRFGYVVGTLVNLALLFAVHVWPGWAAVPFLTDATTEVLPILDASLVVGAAVNLVYVVADPPWLRNLGDAVTAAIALAVIVRVLQVFPFTFADEGWAWIVRLGLVGAAVGTGIGIVVALVRMLTGSPRTS
jgi:hypothetical protein